MLGTFILWYGWHGFNGGSALLSNAHDLDFTVALAAANTSISAGAGGIAALLANVWYLERYTGEAYYDIKHAMNGTLAGLVAITGGCGVVEPWAAMVTGAIAGVLYLLGSKLLIRLRLDDACDAIPVHGLCGCWGLIAVGIFASPTRLMQSYGRANHPGLIYSWMQGTTDFRLLGVQILGIISIFSWVMCIMLPFFIWLDWKGWFRSDPLEEIVGLDTSYHGGLALLASNGEDVVRPEYISAYQKKRSESNKIRMRKPSGPEFAGQSRPTHPDLDMDSKVDDRSEDDTTEAQEGIARVRF
jgi:ammonium transporter, Amt family